MEIVRSINRERTKPKPMVTATMLRLLPCIEKDPPISPQATVIWLHGLGADGHDFEPIVPQLQLPIPVRFVFPHAPRRPVTINGGYVMRAWYDIAAPDLSSGEDDAGIRESAQQLNALIEREVHNGVAPRRIVLAGFSQGGAVALHAGLRYPQRLAGILALSTYLPLANSVALEAHPANRDIPIFMAHGEEDTVVPPPHAHISKQRLTELGYAVEWHSYAMPHSLCSEEIADIAQWLARILSD
jgi:phospholipase/carboxylesterase